MCLVRGKKKKKKDESTLRNNSLIYIQPFNFLGDYMIKRKISIMALSTLAKASQVESSSK